MHALSIAAKLNLSSNMERQVCDLIRRMHTGRWPLFSRMHDIQRVGDELVELAEWRGGGYSIVHWSLTEIALRWQDHATLAHARSAFVVQAVH